MIVTPRFVFLHLHKSGGTFVNECLLRFVPDAQQLGYHLPYSLLPVEFAQLPVLGLVRNPWSYYVSWYAFQTSRPRPNALFNVLSDHGRLDFGGTIRNTLSLGTEGALLQHVLQALPAAYGNSGLNLPAFALAPIANSTLGFYSYLYSYLYGSAAASAQIGRMEFLRRDLRYLLTRVGEPISAGMQAFITHEPPRNASAHTDYVSYYDDALAALVAERDAALIERYGYRFGVTG